MILPTIISVSEAAIRAVPESYYEGALALGATHERSVFFAVLCPPRNPAFSPAVILGVGRAIGETTAVIDGGGQPAGHARQALLKGVRTLTANIVLEMGYAAGLHREALIATAVVLFVFILLINLCFSALKRKEISVMETSDKRQSRAARPGALACRRSAHPCMLRLRQGWRPSVTAATLLFTCRLYPDHAASPISRPALFAWKYTTENAFDAAGDHQHASP